MWSNTVFDVSYMYVFSVETKTKVKMEIYNNIKLCQLRSHIQTPSQLYMVLNLCLNLMSVNEFEKVSETPHVICKTEMTCPETQTG